MNALVITGYIYYGTGLEEQQFPRNYTFFVDDGLIAAVDDMIPTTGNVLMYEAHDINVTGAEACQLLNEYLGARYLNNNVEYYICDPTSDPVGSAWMTTAQGQLYACGVKTKIIRPSYNNRDQTPTQMILSNGQSINNLGYFDARSYVEVSINPDYENDTVYANNIGTSGRTQFVSVDGDAGFQFQFEVIPSDYFVSGGINEKYTAATPSYDFDVRFSGEVDPFTHELTKITDITLRAYKGYTQTIFNALNGVDMTGVVPKDIDYSNPYSEGGISGTGGGNGTLPSGMLDDIDGAAIPNLPGISAADLGFITIYNPTVAQLQSLSSFMWSGAFDLATYKKLFSDPMQSIIGLAIVPVAPSTAGSKSVHFGSIDSGVVMPYLSTNYVQLDCGSVDIEKYVGCFMDNDPYTKISIYLPFVGIRQLSADDIIGGSIHVVYNIDVLNGACACFIEHSTRGVLYSYNGSCITNVPLTSVNFSGAIQNAVSAIGSMIGIAAGVSTGAAPITAMSAIGLATSAANTALNSKPSVQRSGNLGGSAGILSILTPYVIIERPSLSVPNQVQHYVGQTSNITMTLGNCKGFTMCEYVHIDGVSATSEEITEIESMLKAGVIL